MAGPTLDISYKDQNGEDHTIDNQHLFNDLSQNGYNPVGISADGMRMVFQDGRGQYEKPVSEVLQKLGHSDVRFEPIDKNEDHVNLGWAAAVHKLPDDDAKKAYLQSKLTKEGLESPQIIGSGDDWHAYSPSLGQWVSLTNKKGFDSSDLVTGGLDLAKGASAAVGGTLGGAAGFFGGAGAGSIPGAMAGAAGGGVAADLLERGALSALDSDYRNAGSLGSHAKDVAIGGGLDAATAGAFGGAGRLLGKGAQSALSSGAITGAGKTLGGVLGTGGEIAEGVGNFVAKNPGVNQVVTGLNPLTSGTQLKGYLAQGPKAAVTGTANLMRRAGGSEIAEELLGKDSAQALAQKGEQLAAPRSSPKWSGRDIGSKLRDPQHVMGDIPAEEGLSARNVLGNLAEDHAPQSSLSETLSKAVNAKNSGNDELARQLSEEASSMIGTNAAKARNLTGKAEKAGSFIDALSRAGSGAEKLSEEANRQMFNVAAKAGTASKFAGKAIGNVSAAAEPLENFVLSRSGLDYLRRKYQSPTQSSLTTTDKYPWASK